MVKYQDIFDSFLAKILEDDFGDEAYEELDLEEFHMLLNSAIHFFKFPRVSLERNEEGFIHLKPFSIELEIIANYMKVEWLERTILSWENVKPQYDAADWSQGNLLNNLSKILKITRDKAKDLEKIYGRSFNGKSYPFRNLAGGGKNG